MIIDEKISKILEQDVPEVIQQIDEINDGILQVTDVVEKLIQQVKGDKLITDKGLSILDVKNQMMLNYLINLSYIIGQKCNGKSIEDDPAIERLAEIRTVLERIRPIDQKLKYQIEKFVKISLTGTSDKNDPSHFRANPANMMSGLGGSDDESGSDDNDEGGTDDKGSTKKEDKKKGIYVPPKLAAVYYDDDENEATKKQKLQERARKRALHSSVIQELREEYLDTPTEVVHSNSLKVTVSKQQRAKTEYEENYFTRLPISRKEKHRGHQVTTVGNLGDQLTHFEDIRALEGDIDPVNRKKRKLKSNPKKKKGFKKRKTFH